MMGVNFLESKSISLVALYLHGGINFFGIMGANFLESCVVIFLEPWGGQLFGIKANSSSGIISLWGS